MATPAGTAPSLTVGVAIGVLCPCIASWPNTPNEPATKVATDTDAAMIEKIVSRLYQATFGASERCKMAPPESAEEFNTEFNRFSAKYPDLLSLLRSSPYYEPARRHFLQVTASMTVHDTPESLAAECKGVAQLLRAMLDQPEGQKAALEYRARLSPK